MPMLHEKENQGEGGTTKQPNRSADNASIKDAMQKVQTHGGQDDKVDDLGDAIVKPDQGESGPFKADDKTPGKKKRNADKDNAEPIKDVSKSKMVKAAYEAVQELDGDTLGERWEDIQAAINGTLNEGSADVSEEVANLLADEDDLSEDFKKKATVIFESKINSAIRDQKNILENIYTEQLAEEVKTMKEGVVNSLDSYLEYVAEQWLEANEIAVENGIKAELSESFISGMVDLFNSHNIKLPDEQSSVLESLSNERDTIKESLDNSINANIEASKELNTLRIEKAINETCEDLTDTDKSKMRDLVETVKYETVEELTEKLTTLKEATFSEKTSDKNDAAEKILSEELLSGEDQTKDAEIVSTDGEIAQYVEYMNTDRSSGSL